VARHIYAFSISAHEQAQSNLQYLTFVVFCGCRSTFFTYLVIYPHNINFDNDEKETLKATKHEKYEN
jgi:hypothetical protein